MIKKIIKKLVPKPLLLFYHWFLAKLSAWYYFSPSDDLIVIGVTGTNGKTTTVNLISQYLECLGEKTGIASTVNFKIDDLEWLNNKKMTMLGRFQTQKLLRQMVEAGCGYAIIETSSQGIEQFRHSGINYDLVVFTNLTPEHIEAHGSFEAYRNCKEKLFKHLVKSSCKNIEGKSIKKVIVSNADDKETERLQKIKADKFFTYGIEQTADWQARSVDIDGGDLYFVVNDQSIKANFLGKFNVYNILAAISTVDILGFDLSKAAHCLLRGVPGRQEWIEEGQPFKIMVDYAPEPESLKNLYKALEQVPKKRLIHVLGSCGGGRDKARQPILGKMAGQAADVVVVTNEDPYNDDPMQIINHVAQGVAAAGKQKDKNLFEVLDRQDGIRKAMDIAQPGDLVLITGKGAEQFICGHDGKNIPHDDRRVVRKFLKNK